jgi:23S rRNA (cytidine1920-2'-O)/16S rRNA (cytidine1409-2'-O)-methyltransferase
VGYGQLAWKLRTDPRVVNIEKCNVRYLDPALIAEPADFISIDVSFISLKLILPIAAELLAEEGTMVCLVKPQFEAGREQVGKNGIVRDTDVHLQVVENCIGYAEENGLYPYGLTFSPVKGAKGNIEFLLYVGKSENLRYNLSCIQTVVKSSHEELK